MSIQDKEDLKRYILFLMGDFVYLLMNVEAFSGTKGSKFAAQFLHKSSALMAVDESTTIKTPSASRTKNVLRVGKLAQYRRIMTGSPVTKNPLDVFSQLEFLK
jgi:hypothetical protein